MNIRPAMVLVCLFVAACTASELQAKGCLAGETAEQCEARQRRWVEDQPLRDLEARSPAIPIDEQWKRPPAPTLTEEDVLYCQMQAQQTAAAADTGYGGMFFSAFNAAASGAMVRDTCQRMRLAARQHR